jgi:tetratricopeptide (TPR) repeat protein
MRGGVLTMIQLKQTICPCLWLVSLVNLSAAGAFQRDQIQHDNAGSAIGALIDELGHPDYSVRESARDTLLTRGVDAFDQLFEAQVGNADAEVRAVARWLISKIEINWQQDDLPDSLQAIVIDYSKIKSDQRLLRLERIHQSECWQRFPLLSKIARYEIKDELSQIAAIDLIVSNQRQLHPQRELIEQEILAAIGNSNRLTCKWIREAIRLEHQPDATCEFWLTLIQPEIANLQKPGSLNEGSVRLVRWLCDEAIRLSDQKTLENLCNVLVLNARDELVELSEIADWLIRRKLWSPLDALLEQNRNTFESNSWLLFRIAEARWQQGDMVKSQQISDRANSLISDDQSRRLEIAMHLRRNGYSRIAFELLSRNLADSQLGSNVWVYTRLMASEWLHDQQRDSEAVEVLTPLVDWLGTEQAIKQFEKPTFPRNPAQIKSRYHYFLSLHHRRAGNPELAQQHLIEGLKHDTDDSDLLIAVHRTTGMPQQWKTTVDELIEQSLVSWNREIEGLQQLCAVETDSTIRKLQNRRLASQLNRWAWLSANTGSDIQTALKYSQQSLNLRPDSPFYLDTMASCYYAIGDIDLAVKYQEKAISFAPESAMMREQLEKYMRGQSELVKRPGN